MSTRTVPVGQFEQVKRVTTYTLQEMKAAGTPIAMLTAYDYTSARIIDGAETVYYPGAPHGITATHQDQVNADLLAFLRS